MVSACTISTSGLDSRRFSSFSEIVYVVAPGKCFTFIVCCFKSPLSWILVNIESPATKIFRLIWLLLDCCFDDQMFGFLCFDITAAFEWKVLIYRQLNLHLKFQVALDLSSKSESSISISKSFFEENSCVFKPTKASSILVKWS